MTEKVGVAAYNPRGVTRLTMPRPTVILRLVASKAATLSADFAMTPIGEAKHEVRVHVTYVDIPNPGASPPLKLFIGTYEDGKVDAKDEREDVLKEVLTSYPAQWAAFLKELPEAIKVAEVMLL